MTAHHSGFAPALEVPVYSQWKYAEDGITAYLLRD